MATGKVKRGNFILFVLLNLFIFNGCLGNKDSMTEDKFWKIISKTKNSENDSEKQNHALRNILKTLNAKQIKDFDRIHEDTMAKAYGWHLWGACYIFCGGCSDDGFTEFRNWLISQGKEIFYYMLKDPDSLVDKVEIPIKYKNDLWPLNSDFDLIPRKVYEEKTGEEMDYYFSQPKKPYGDEWEEDFDVLKKLYPNIWSKYYKK